jgi:asparagine synthase (glutamine-hydrolysing)
MCGIFGCTECSQAAQVAARRALGTLKHRGPDQWGEKLFNDGVYLGHRRLSILDLSEQGKQPMYSEEHQVAIMVNGEIYNYQKLKLNLKDKYKFKSTSDSEVVLFGYIEWGIEGLLERIDGMYAICVYDVKEAKVFLARDRVGIKPLYYAQQGGRFCWGSELKAIESILGDTLTVDYTACYDFLTYLYVPSPKTLYKDVFKLEPAHYVAIFLRKRVVEKKRYWRLDATVQIQTFEQASANLSLLVSKSVGEQMVSDVPVGFFLSGGIDSSAVVCAASKLRNEISSFTIGFEEKEHDEREYAQLVATKFGTVHHSRVLSQSAVDGMFSRLRKWYDEPFGDTSAFPTFLVSEFARESVTVVLTGEGGDELFGGYTWYKQYGTFRDARLPFAQSLRPMFTQLKRMCNNPLLHRVTARLESHCMQDDLELYAKLMGGMIRSEKQHYRNLWGLDSGYDDYWHFRKYYREDLPLRTRLQYMDFHTYLPDDILTKVDRVSMAVSLEARVPLLSQEIVEFAFSLPEEVRFYKDRLKGLLRTTFASELPSKVLNRRKMGFCLPPSVLCDLVGSHGYRQVKILKELYPNVVAF